MRRAGWGSHPHILQFTVDVLIELWYEDRNLVVHMVVLLHHTSALLSTTVDKYLSHTHTHTAWGNRIEIIHYKKMLQIETPNRKVLHLMDLLIQLTLWPGYSLTLWRPCAPAPIPELTDPPSSPFVPMSTKLSAVEPQTKAPRGDLFPNLLLGSIVVASTLFFHSCESLAALIKGRKENLARENRKMISVSKCPTFKL